MEAKTACLGKGPAAKGAPSAGVKGEGRAILPVERALPPSELAEGTRSCHRKWVEPSSP